MFRRVLAVVFVGLLVSSGFIPTIATAQCNVTTTFTGMGTQTGMGYLYVQKYFFSDVQCTLTMSMSVIGCSPNPNSTTSILSGSAFTTAVAPSCGWNCSCGSVTIDTSDGLPVELMEFEIEAEAAASE